MAESTREQIERAVGAVLFNVRNFPEAAQVRLLGQDMSGLRGTITDAVVALLEDKAPGTYRSIVQLAEGSTFYARQHGDPQERFWFLAAGMGVVSLDAIMAHANSIDSSTIRDVTPPRTTAVRDGEQKWSADGSEQPT